MRRKDRRAGPDSLGISVLLLGRGCTHGAHSGERGFANIDRFGVWMGSYWVSLGKPWSP